MVRLPVSGIEVILRQPAGVEDLLLLEAPSCNTALALALAARLARPVDGAGVDWSALAVTDLEALLLRVRQMAFGDLIHADVVCLARGCGALAHKLRVSAPATAHEPGGEALPLGTGLLPSATWGGQTALQRVLHRNLGLASIPGIVSESKAHKAVASRRQPIKSRALGS